MPRTARLDIPGLLHHVIVRGIERRSIFLDDQDRTFFLERLSTLLLETQTDCLAWSLLNNHFHLLLRPRSGSLSSFMQRLLTSFAVTFNLRHGRSGHLFQNRYKSLLCDEENYFLELVRYIHLNPLRGGLVETCEDLTRYPWSGHAVLMGNRLLDGQTTGEVLERFGKTPKSGRAGYKAFIADGLKQQAPDPEQAKGLRRWLAEQLGRESDLTVDERILGDEDFSQQVRHFGESAPSPIAIPLPQLLERVAAVFDVSPEMLQWRTRSPGVAEARAVLCFLAIRNMGHSGAEIARMLRMSRSGVSIAIGRGENILKGRAELQEVLTS